MFKFYSSCPQQWRFPRTRVAYATGARCRAQRTRRGQTGSIARTIVNRWTAVRTATRTTPLKPTDTRVSFILFFLLESWFSGNPFMWLILYESQCIRRLYVNIKVKSEYTTSERSTYNNTRSITQFYFLRDKPHCKHYPNKLVL